MHPKPLSVVRAKVTPLDPHDKGLQRPEVAVEFTLSVDVPAGPESVALRLALDQFCKPFGYSVDRRGLTISCACVRAGYMAHLAECVARALEAAVMDIWALAPSGGTLDAELIQVLERDVYATFPDAAPRD